MGIRDDRLGFGGIEGEYQYLGWGLLVCFVGKDSFGGGAPYSSGCRVTLSLSSQFCMSVAT